MKIILAVVLCLLSLICQGQNRSKKWINTQGSSTKAENLNTLNNNYLNSLLKYNPNSGTIYAPTIINPPQWFDADISGITFNGCATQVCNTAIAVYWSRAMLKKRILSDGTGFSLRELFAESQMTTNKILVSPNPSNGFFDIRSIEKNSDFSIISLYDATGKIIVKLDLKTIHKFYKLNISAFPNGVYYLKIGNRNNSVLIEKLIILK